MKNICIALTTLIFIFSLADDLWAKPYKIMEANYRLTYEAFKLPNNEPFGLLGASYLISPATPLYIGISAYSAIKGERGGFFTGGLTAGIKRKLKKNSYFDAGFFVGGGGGGAAPQGGGLMLRPHMGLSHTFNAFDIGLQLARVDFPNGDIRSDHLALILNIPFDTILLKDTYKDTYKEKLSEIIGRSGRKISLIRNYFGLFFKVYSPYADSRNTDEITKTPQFNLVGAEYGQFMSNKVYLFLQLGGAMRGDSDGFAEIFAGAGYRQPLIGSNEVILDGRLALGAAGGGRVDTGGGLVYKASLGPSFRITNNIRLRADLSHLDSFSGSFSAKELALNMEIHSDFLSFSNERNLSDYGPASLSLKKWQIGFSGQRYLHVGPKVRKTVTADEAVSLFSIRIDKMNGTYDYLTGKAIGAFDGGAGGYAVGLIGLGLKSNPLLNNKIRLFAELTAGAAGGGGVSVGGGLIVQTMAGVEYHINDLSGFSSSFGRIKAKKGDLDSNVVEVGFFVKFATLASKSGL